LLHLRWIDAACNSDWDMLFRLAICCKWNIAVGRFVNSMRLCSSSELEFKDGNSLVLKSSAYTTLHQAAWKGVPVEIIQALLKLGASYKFTCGFPFK